MKLFPLTNSIHCLLTICCCVATTPTMAADQVTRLSDGATIRGRFETLSSTQIVVRQSNDQTETVSTDDIREIRFNREPPPLQTARSNERSGSYAAAIDQLEQVRSDYSGGDRRVPVEIDFLIARCQARLAADDPAVTPAAITSLQDFIGRNQDGYRTLESTLLLAQLLAEVDRDRAVPLIEELRGSGVDGFAMQAGVVLGHILLDEGRFDEARQMFDQLVQETRDTPTELTTHYDSRLGRAECLRQQGEFQEAIQDLQSFIAEVPDEQDSTLARAWILLGDCYRESNQSQAALLAYLHVDILYDESTTEHAEALHRLGPLWEAAGHSDRSRDAELRLLNQYPQTKWALQRSEGSATRE